jgi:hypothetical protein
VLTVGGSTPELDGLSSLADAQLGGRGMLVDCELDGSARNGVPRIRHEKGGNVHGAGSFDVERRQQGRSERLEQLRSTASPAPNERPSVWNLREMRRVVRPSGGVWIGTPNRSRLVGYVGSRDTNSSVKIVWNLDDRRLRLRGRFRNALGGDGRTIADESP